MLRISPNFDLLLFIHIKTIYIIFCFVVVTVNFEKIEMRNVKWEWNEV